MPTTVQPHVMKSAIDHLRVAQENAFRDPNIGFDFEVVRDNTEVTRTIHEGILAEVIGSDIDLEFPGDGLNLRRNLRHMASTLHYDLWEKILPAQRPQRDEIVVGFLPIGVVTRCVLCDVGRADSCQFFPRRIGDADEPKELVHLVSVAARLGR